MLHPQNGDRIVGFVATDSVTSLHPVYSQLQRVNDASTLWLWQKSEGPTDTAACCRYTTCTARRRAELVRTQRAWSGRVTQWKLTWHATRQLGITEFQQHRIVNVMWALRSNLLRASLDTLISRHDEQLVLICDTFLSIQSYRLRSTNELYVMTV